MENIMGFFKQLDIEIQNGEQDTSLGDMLKASLAGQPFHQLTLDLRIKCPVTDVMMSATARNSKAVYWAERRMILDPNNREWQRYVRAMYFQQYDKQ